MFNKVLKKNIILIFLIISLLVLCLLAKYYFYDIIIKIDESIRYFIINNFLNNFLTSLMKGVTQFASFFGVISVFIISIILFKDRFKKITLIFSICLISLLSSTIKILFLRERPLESIIKMPNSYSFPSGHTFFAIGFFGLVVYFILKSNLNKYLKYFLSISIILIIIMIPFSRVYLGVHHFTDVIGGLLFGILVLLISINIYKTLKEEKKMNGLVLEGGGARGSYHVGSLKAFKERNIKFDYVVGTSIGSINGVFVATNELDKLETLWKSASSKELFGIDESLFNAIKNREFTKDNIKKGLQTVYQVIKNAGIDTSALKEMLIKNIDEDKLRKSNIEYGLATYNISKAKKVQVFKNGIPKGKLIEYLLASSYLPIFKFKKIIDENYYLDGGAYDKCPLDMLIDKKLNNIYVVRTHRDKLPKYKTNSKIYEIKSYKKLGSIIAFSKDVTNYNIKLGYYDTIKVLDNLDGNEYYFKDKKEEYYNKILTNKNILKKYNKWLIVNNKRIIINTLENICEFYKINKFKIYRIPALIIRIKVLNRFKKSPYSDFIKELKVKF